MIGSILSWIRKNLELAVLFGGAPFLVAMVAVHTLVDQPMIAMTTSELTQGLDSKADFTAEILKMSGISVVYIALCTGLISVFVHLARKPDKPCKRFISCLTPFIVSLGIFLLIWGFIYCALDKPITRSTNALIDAVYENAVYKQVTPETAQSSWMRAGQRNILHYTVRAFGFATLVVGVFCTMMIVASAKKGKARSITTARSLLLNSMTAMTVLLVASSVLIVLSLHIHHPLYENKLVFQRFDRFAHAVGVLWGCIFTSTLAGIYVPSVFRLQDLSKTPAGRSNQLLGGKQSLEVALATLAPLIAAALSAFFGDI